VVHSFNIRLGECLSFLLWKAQPMDNPGNVNRSEGGVKLEVQLIFTSCLGVVQPGMLLPIAVEEFNLETALVVKQDFSRRHGHIRAEVKLV